MDDDIQRIMDHYQLPVDQIFYLLRNKSAYCKCGKFRLLKSSKQSRIGKCLYRCCGAKECEPNFGKLRPNHSVIMRDRVINGSIEYRNTLLKPGIVNNPEVNSLQFKRKRLIKHGRYIDTMTDDDVLKEYSNLLSHLSTNRIRKRNDIVFRYNNWEQEFKDLILIVTNNIIPSIEWLGTLNEPEINRLWARIHGINTIRNNQRVNSTRKHFYKHEIISGFEHNTANQTRVFARSGLEAKYIKFFEENSIPWEFETIRLETIQGDGFHVPDFLIRLHNEIVMLETKGTFYWQPYDEYYSNKILAAINFCKQKGYRYILTQKEPDVELKFIDNSLLNIKEDVC